jgi:hypothetical protein
VAPKAGLDDVEKRKCLTLPGLNSKPSVVQPVASRYTDYARVIVLIKIVVAEVTTRLCCGSHERSVRPITFLITASVMF